MLKELLKNPAALVYAILVHAALIAILVVSIQWNSKPAPLQGSDKIVQATVVDQTTLQAEKQRKLDEEQRRRDEADARRKAAEDQQRQAELEQRRAEEAQRKKQQEAEQQRLAKLKADKEAKERQRIAQQKAEQQRVAAQEARRKAEVEAKRQADLAARRKAEEQRQAEEAKRKAEEQRKADEARRQRENEEMLKQQLAQEEADRQAQEVAAKRQQELNSLQAQYTAMLTRLVNRNWIRPPNARPGMRCLVRVRLIPSGDVVEVHTVKSSGDRSFDDSAEKAVLRSSPWPQPPDAALFHREVDFLFNPEG